MEEKENNYKESDIKVLEFPEHVRLRPAMYIGALGTQGGMSMMKGITRELLELIPNLELNIFITNEDEIQFSFFLKQKEALEFAEAFEKPSQLRDDVFFLLVTTALSNNFQLILEDDQKTYVKKFIDGRQTSPEKAIGSFTNELVMVECKFTLSSLIVSFVPDDLWNFILYLNQLACMFPAAKIFMEDERTEKPTNLSIHRPDGLVELMKGNAQHKKYFDNESGVRIHFSGVTNNITYQILIDDQHVLYEGCSKMVFFNGEPCHSRCSHMLAVTDAMLAVADEIRNANENLKDESHERTLNSFNIYISAFQLDKVDDLQYYGSTKYRFVSESIYSGIKSATMEKIRLECAANEKVRSIFAIINTEKE